MTPEHLFQIPMVDALHILIYGIGYCTVQRDCISYEIPIKEIWHQLIRLNNHRPIMANIVKRRNQQFSRRKEPLIKKSQEITALYDVNGAFFTLISKTDILITINYSD